MTNCSEEIWKPIEGYEGLYEVSNTGKVKSLEKYVKNKSKLQFRPERVLKPGGDNYYIVALCKDGKVSGKAVHRLVAQAFIPNPENKPNIDHIDANPKNNHVSNLRWVTQSENLMNPVSRKHISDAKSGHSYWGRPLTDEEKAKISKANKGRVFSEEHKRKLSEARKNIDMDSINKERFTGKHWKTEGGKRVWYA